MNPKSSSAEPAHPLLDDESPVGPRDDGAAPDAKALAVERKRMAERMEQLKNDKLRRQLEQMEAEVEAEAAPRDGPSSAPRSAPPVMLATPRKRHWVAMASMIIAVILPVLSSAWYLWTRAHDRYVSYAGFSVRTEEVGSAFELLGGVAELSGSSSSDTDILYKFIQSPDLVARIDAQLDLRESWGRPGRAWSNGDHDPVYAYNPEGWVNGLLSGTPDEPPVGTIEDLTEYWASMVKVYSDSGTGLIDLEVQAFTPKEAQVIAQLIYDESSAMINRLSTIAREDATGYAREELDKTVEQLKSAREALTRFRNRTQIVDPTAALQGQTGLLSSLQAQLAQTLIDLDVQRQTTREGDPRITQLEGRVKVIEERIEEERRKLGNDSGGDGAFANLVGEYERLAVDLEYAQQSYTNALAAYDSALSEAQRQSRYLAAHVTPTLPEKSTRPQRMQVLGLVALFSFLAWATAVLAVYAMRDRR